jgi:hypothetical protein
MVHIFLILVVVVVVGVMVINTIVRNL